MTTGKTIALTLQIFVGNIIALLFNVLSRFVIAKTSFQSGRNHSSNRAAMVNSMPKLTKGSSSSSNPHWPRNPSLPPPPQDRVQPPESSQDKLPRKYDPNDSKGEQHRTWWSTQICLLLWSAFFNKCRKKNTLEYALFQMWQSIHLSLKVIYLSLESVNTS